jgi:anti-anti-sigma regulatory factor
VEGLRLTISRALATVVVTLHGMLDRQGAGQLETALRDLIEDQGNLAVVVDASHLTGSDPAAAIIFCQASVWARRRNGSFMVNDPADILSSELARAAAATGVVVEQWGKPGSWTPDPVVGDG